MIDRMSAFLNPNLDSLFRGAEAMDARLRARLSARELFALAFAFSSIGVWIWIYRSVDCLPFDYNVYMLTAGGDLRQYYYADWLLPLFRAWALLPYWWGYAIWGGWSVLSLFFAARVFGGRTALTFLTFQSFYVLCLGQMVGWIIGALALAWWALAHRRWHLAGLAFFFAGAKFQIGLPLGLLLWLAAEIRWRDRLRVLIVPAALALLSLAVSPAWPADLLARTRAIPPYDWGSISLWHWIGAAALLLWLPPLALPLQPGRRFLALAAAVPLALPYFQQADLLALYVLPVGWLPVLLGNFGLLFFQFQFKVLVFLWIVPLSVYLSVILPAFHSWLRSGAGNPISTWVAHGPKNRPRKRRGEIPAEGRHPSKGWTNGGD
jgi:hypothetical protein